MRTTVNLDDDVVMALSTLRQRDGLGVSAALNRLARAGLARLKGPPPAYRHRPRDLGLRIDVANIAEVLDLLDET